ncbi:glycine C-acetyltransferase [Cohnella zeiphila]|uniref:Glycine C-acetyltransferase n=1 Tax=Cohnella zeiphila TaxID=2761120 RepID=A0A7X0SLS2_9BACL|nr:glycine C-acetyltransferase [Cohnella zeiphila]MBB6732358.1 glycine C-acetyltransferase [Cohnella zeiphila]
MADFRVLADELAQLRTEGRYRPLRVWESPQGVSMMSGGKTYLQFSSNNYLGLTGHDDVKRAAVQAIERYGVGSGSVRTIVGTLDVHAALEAELARFKGTEAALVFQSGYTANLAALSSILGADDAVISDELNHASIIDGIRLTKATRKVYAHKSMEQLEKLLRESASFRQRVVVTDGVFSMDGDIAPLPDIVALAERYDALVYVDDAHASGVLGRSGKGSVEHFGLYGRVHVQIGTLSKALGVTGGYVAGSSTLIDYLLHKARPFLFSTAPTPAVAASCLAAVQVLERCPQLVRRLWDNADYMRSGLQALGFDTGASETPIIPIVIGDPAATARFSDLLAEDGLFAQSIVFPMVAWDKGRVRLIVTAEHSRQDLDLALACLERAGKAEGLLSA